MSWNNMSASRPARAALLLVAAILAAGCAPAAPSHANASATVSGPTPTPTLRPCTQQDATFKELPEIAGGIYSMVVGPDGNLWVTTTNAVARVTPAGAINSYPVAGSPYDILVGPDHHLWFLEHGSDGAQIGRIALDGTLQAFSLPEVATIPAGNLVAGPDGNVWYLANSLIFGTASSGSFSSWIGRVTPAGAVTQFPIPRSSVGNPFASTISDSVSLVAGRDGNIWFAVNQIQIGGRGSDGAIQTSQVGGYVGSVTPSGTIHAVQLPVPSDNVQTLVAGPDGTIWVSLTSHDFTSGKVDRIAPDGTVSEYPLSSGFATAILALPDGSVWLAVTPGFRNAAIFIGHISATGAVSEAAVLTPSGRGNYVADDQFANQLAATDSEHIWFTERLFDAIGRFTPNGASQYFPLPASAHAFGIPLNLAMGPDGTLWYSRNFYKNTPSPPVSGVVGSMRLPATCV